MKVKYLGIKLAISFATIAATPLVWSALAWPQWQAQSAVEQPAASLPVEAESPAPATVRRIVIVPRLVDAAGRPIATQDATAPAGTAPGPALTQQTAAAAPPPQSSQPAARPATATRSSASTRGS